MAQFIRVRDKATQHEYDTPLGEVNRAPDLYVVIDDVPVNSPRPPKHYVKPATVREPKPSVGKTKKETPDGS